MWNWPETSEPSWRISSKNREEMGFLVKESKRERGGGEGGRAGIKKMHLGLCQCQLPSYDIGLCYTTCYYLVMSSRVHRLSIIPYNCMHVLEAGV